MSTSGVRDIYHPSVDAVAVRRFIGMVFQQPNPFATSIFNNVAFGLRLNNFKGDKHAKVEEALKRAALWDEVKDKLHKSGLSLSGGQQQRLCIARAIATEPEVLLMDEPCSALDPIATRKIEELMLELKTRFTIAIVTHNLQQAQRVADHTGFLYVDTTQGGRTGYLVEFGESKQIFEDPREKYTQGVHPRRVQLRLRVDPSQRPRQENAGGRFARHEEGEQLWDREAGFARSSIASCWPWRHWDSGESLACSRARPGEAHTASPSRRRPSAGSRRHISVPALQAVVCHLPAAHPQTVITYDSVGSGEGIRRFLGRDVKDEDKVDFGASDAAMQDERYCPGFGRRGHAAGDGGRSGACLQPSRRAGGTQTLAAGLCGYLFGRDQELERSR